MKGTWHGFEYVITVSDGMTLFGGNAATEDEALREISTQDFAKLYPLPDYVYGRVTEWTAEVDENGNELHKEKHLWIKFYQQDWKKLNCEWEVIFDGMVEIAED